MVEHRGLSQKEQRGQSPKEVADYSRPEFRKLNPQEVSELFDSDANASLPSYNFSDIPGIKGEIDPRTGHLTFYSAVSGDFPSVSGSHSSIPCPNSPGSIHMNMHMKRADDVLDSQVLEIFKEMRKRFNPLRSLGYVAAVVSPKGNGDVPFSRLYGKAEDHLNNALGESTPKCPMEGAGGEKAGIPTNIPKTALFYIP